jgi:hypothetical protein
MINTPFETLKNGQIPFDWMGMNEEILSNLILNLELWFDRQCKRSIVEDVLQSI